jgi:protein involved in polysaccharide export with SLBB domain
MSAASASFSVTMRVALDDPRGIGTITNVIADAGGSVTALDIVGVSGRSNHGGRHVQRN